MMENDILNMLNELRPEFDFTDSDDFVMDGLLDSFDIISIVSEVNEEFDVDINVNDLLPENFNSAKALYELIQKLQYE